MKGIERKRVVIILPDDVWGIVLEYVLPTHKEWADRLRRQRMGLLRQYAPAIHPLIKNNEFRNAMTGDPPSGVPRLSVQFLLLPGTREPANTDQAIVHHFDQTTLNRVFGVASSNARTS